MYAEALDSFRELARTDPQSRTNQFNLALAYLNAQKPEDAIRVLRELTTQHPNDADALGLLGRAYEASSKLSLALDAYRRALNTDPGNPDRYLDYTKLLMDANRFEDAAQSVIAGLHLIETKYALYVRLGSIRLLEGELPKARQSFREAIELHPEIALGYVAMAKSYLQEGSDTQAAKILSDARRKLAPDFALEYFYGLTLVRLQRNEEAATVLEHAVRMDPSVPEPHYELGRAYFALNRIDRARIEFERVIQLAPQDARAHYQLSRIYAKLGNSEKARELAEETKQLKQTKLDEALDIQRNRMESFRSVH
jgi:tetratricopeptide (TPR) repeat protein